MENFTYHNDVKITEGKPEWNPDLPFALKLDFNLQNLDVSLVNGLRRVCLSEVPTISVGPNIDIDIDKNITVFNSQYLKDRFSQQPIHLDEVAKVNHLSKLIFKIADPDDHTQPLKNNENADRHITTGDLIVLEEIGDEETIDDEITTTDGGNNGDDDDDVNDEREEKAQVEFTVQANAQKDLLAGEIAGEAPQGIGTKPGAEETAPKPDSELNMSQNDIIKKYRRLDSKDYFTFLDTYLATLKKGESLYSVMKPTMGRGKEHARWQTCIITYRFMPMNPNVINNPEMWDENYNPIKARQNYPREKGIFGKYDSPETFQISVEYNGHYRPELAWVASISTLKQKIEKFMEGVRTLSITGESGQINEIMSAVFSKDIPHLVTFTITNEDHTLGNIIASHYLYALHRLVKNDNKQLLNSFSHYRVPHPLDKKLVIMLKVPDIQLDFSNVIDEGVNPYDDYVSPTLRLLMIVTDRVVNTLNALEEEAKDILKLGKENEIPTELTMANLPQAKFTYTTEEVEESELISEVAQEELDIIGKAEEQVEDQ